MLSKFSQLVARPKSRGLTLYSTALGLVLGIFVLGGCSSAYKHPTGSDQPEQTELSGDLLYQLLAGEFAGNSGHLDEAVMFYGEAADNSNDARIAARATYIALYSQDYEAALESLERWQTLAPEATDIDRMYAIAYLKQHEPEKAVPYIRKTLVEAGATPDQQALGVKKLLTKEANTEDGLVVLEILNRTIPANPQMMILQARYAAHMERFDEAVSILDRVLTVDPSLSDVYIIKSRILAAQGRTEESLDIIQQVLDNDPINTGLRLRFARLLVDEGKLEKAREQFQILREQEPHNTDVLLSLALLYIETRELDEGRHYLEEILMHDEKTDVANYYLGRIAQNQGESKLAISHYVKVQYGQYKFDSKLRIAGLFAKLGKHEEALDQLETLAEKQSSWPKRVRAYLARGGVLRSMGRYKEALDMYNRVLQQNPDDSDLLYARAMVAEKVDRLDITESDLRKVLSTEPENANALNALGYTLADRTERLDEALQYIKKAADLVPDDPAILDSLGWVSYRLGRMQEALKWLSKAYEKMQDAEIAAHYGEVLWKTNQQQKAREVWEKARKQDADHPVLVDTLRRLQP